MNNLRYLTLKFDLQLNLTLTNTFLVLECASRYYGKYEVFDLHMTLTLVFDLKWPCHLHTLCLYPSPYNNHVCQYPLSLWPHLVTPSPEEPHPLPVPFIPITLSQEPHPLCASFEQSDQTLLPHSHKNHTLCWYTLSFWPHPITTSLEEPHPLLVPYIPIIPSQEPCPLQLSWIPITLPITPSAEEPHPLLVPFITITLFQEEPHPLTVPFIPITIPITPSADEPHPWQYPESLKPHRYPIPTRTAPFAGALHPYYPIPRRTTPFVGTLRQSDHIILPHLHKNHTLWQYSSSLLPHPQTNHTLCW